MARAGEAAILSCLRFLQTVAADRPPPGPLPLAPTFPAAPLCAPIQMRAEQGHVLLSYRHCSGGAEWKDEQYLVCIVRTPCNLVAHALGSSARRSVADGVAILYVGGIFACRHSYQLAYGSVREHAVDRAAIRADRLRARLGWESGILNGEGGKPKWMRWRTFDRLTAEHDAFVGESLAAAVWHQVPGDTN